jgi:hypothetical protein
MTATVPILPGTDFDLVLLGWDAATAGAAFTVTVDGTPYTGGVVNGNIAASTVGYPTTSNTQMQSSGGSALNHGFCQMAIPLHGLSSAVHTIVVTHTGSAGQFLAVDSLLTQSPNPQTIVVPQVAHLGALGYLSYGFGSSATIDDIYNSIIQTVVGLFPSDGSVQTWNPNTAGWNPIYGVGGHLSSMDPTGVHPHDGGMAFIADSLMGLLNSLTAREGLVTI